MVRRFTSEARDVVAAAQREAQRLGRNEVAPVHLLLGMLDGVGPASDVLGAQGLTGDEIRDRLRQPAGDYLTVDDADALRTIGIDLDAVLENLVGSFGPDVVARARPPRRRVRFSQPSKKVLQLALREATWLKSEGIAGEHLLLGLLRAADPVVTRLLTDCGAAPGDLRAATLRSLGRAA
jgi:ATP-dependent Clp protease ATP-binding subunit ClpA